MLGGHGEREKNMTTRRHQILSRVTRGCAPSRGAANHPQLGAALSNVAELNRVYLETLREALREQEAEARQDGKPHLRDPKPRRGGSVSKKSWGSQDRKMHYTLDDCGPGAPAPEEAADAKSRKASKSSRGQPDARSTLGLEEQSDSDKDSEAAPPHPRARARPTRSSATSSRAAANSDGSARMPRD